ncbi:hypothetical protein [Leucothrix arctica]|uniref:Uncharacterized protein n=1 Tax=Leucothrix arctica TaxID=1481894 RepID=A0A317C958_9GAMM|nr:hypothetical protein [Leucothrix arctica]PWQ95058.1 hypothetical protein DKT75_13645 [Leucothrix arctica]
MGSTRLLGDDTGALADRYEDFGDAIETLRKEFAVPIIGVEPGVKPATQLTKTGRIAVLATQYTADSGYLKQVGGASCEWL